LIVARLGEFDPGYIDSSLSSVTRRNETVLRDLTTMVSIHGSRPT
jgi:hypothetical protein